MPTVAQQHALFCRSRQPVLLRAGESAWLYPPWLLTTAEHVLEASYAIDVTDNYTIQPDIQYVIRPNGASDIKNAVVIGIQFIAKRWSAG